MRGSLALSHFRLERLRAKINDIVPQVDSISAEFIHFIDLEETLSKPENDTLSELLSYHTFDPVGVSTAAPTVNAILDPIAISLMREQQIEQSLIFVVPKPGIISFWSEKATEIAHYCGLKKIRRIERGIVYAIAASERLTWGDEQAIANLLYNLQTETILYRLEDTEFLFKKLEQKPVQAVDALEENKKLIATFVGFTVSHLRIPGFEQPWETTDGKTKELASSLELMLKVPVWQRKFNNAFECPHLGGCFRTDEPVIAGKNEQVKTAALFSEPALKMKWQDKLFQNKMIDNKNSNVIEKTREKRAETMDEPLIFSPIDLSNIYLEEAIFRLLKFPCIADKSFLITIKDRTVTGRVVRDQMVGPWQVPVADCAVLVNGFDTYRGEAIAMGERAPLARLNPAASARMAVGEAITNIVSAQISALSEIQLSANCEGKSDTVIEAICAALSPTLGIAFSLNQEETDAITPLQPPAVIVSAYAPVVDVRTVLTPVLVQNNAETLLIFIDLSNGEQRLGGSALAQVFNQLGDKTPDVDNPALLSTFFTMIQQLHLEGKILAYHDRSDGGLFITLCEMAFASHMGLQIDVSELGSDPLSILFNEELGAVIQIRAEDIESVLAVLSNDGINGYVIGTLDETDQISIVFNEEMIFSAARIILQKTWSETSFQLQALRDNPRCAKKQFEALNNGADPGLNVDLSFDLKEDIVNHFINVGTRPRIAILREERTETHREMAAAFERAHFECVDVYMQDLENNAQSLVEFKGLAVGGGFSFGDILGAGLGWAKRILFNASLSDQFEAFFNRSDTFTLGLSNGCQMLLGLKKLIPGAHLMPQCRQNYSEQFESRLCLVEVQASNAVLLQGMERSRLLVPVAHKEGRIVFENEAFEEESLQQGLVALRYVDNWGRKTKMYPANPSGSALGITGVTTRDGRVLCMMPHPERVFRTIQHSWHPGVWGEEGPWLRIFQNARKWVG